MRLHIVMGTACSGVEARTVALAHATAAPVVVLDRLQTYPELSTTSDRPPRSRLNDTNRIYLADRRVAEGAIPLGGCCDRLHVILDVLRNRGPMTILEARSAPLLQAALRDGVLDNHSVTFEYRDPEELPGHHDRLLRRVRRKLAPPDHGRPLVAELVRAARRARNHTFLETISDFTIVWEWWQEHGDRCYFPEQAADSLDLVRDLLTAQIAQTRRGVRIFEEVMVEAQHQGRRARWGQLGGAARAQPEALQAAG